MLGIAPDLN